MTSLAGTGRCDPGLIEAARGGDEKALVSLLAAAQPDVRRYARRNCRAADIDDAVQETLLLLYRRVGTLRAVTSFSAWLFAVARRACLRLLRRSTGMADASAAEVEGRLAHLAPEDIRIDLSRAIQSLPEHYREVILLRELEGLTYQEIATVTEIPIGTVMSRLSRGRRQLHDRLASCPEGEAI